MTRADLLAALEILLDPVPVVSHPLEAVLAPAVIVGGSNRIRPSGAYWQAQWEIVVLAGRMDDTDVYDTADTMQNAVCLALDKLPGSMSDIAQPDAPAPITIGSVDYLGFTFTFTDHRVVGTCA